MIEAAIVLAAGRGARMGGPKALLAVDGEALVTRHVRRLAELGCGRVIVAVPIARVADVERLLCGGAQVIGVDTASQSETLVRALAALDATLQLPPEARVLITPVDLLPPRLDTLRALAQADADAAHPRHAGRNGHPIVVRRRALDRLDAAAPLPLDQLLGDVRVAVEVDDAATLADFDEPADLQPNDTKK